MQPPSLPERWLPVVGIDHYEVSDQGRVRSQLQTGPRGHFRRDWLIMNPDVDRDGYQSVCLRREGKKVRRRVHHLVLEAFVGPRPDGTEARHFPDNNRANNRLDNLAWDTHVDNIGDKAAHGTAQVGSRHAMAKLTEADIPTIRRRRECGESLRSIAKDYGITETSVSFIYHRKTWAHV